MTISDHLLARFSEFISACTGLHFPGERRRDLIRGIGSIARDFGFGDLESCIHWLMSHPPAREKIEILASRLTIGETYFFRDKKIFEILERDILRELLQSRRGSGQYLKIWSAGCSTGEEPYSLAILLNKMLPGLNDWNITILGTDINPLFLQKAREGVYSNWSFRDTPPWVRERYFKRTKEGRFEVVAGIKKMVKFFYLNLAEDVYPSFSNNTIMADLIFCRNVLMYLAPESREKVIQNLYRSLADGGWLIVSPGETSQILSAQFTAVSFPGAILYQKRQQKDFPAQNFEENARFSGIITAVDSGCHCRPGTLWPDQAGLPGESTARTPTVVPEQQQTKEPLQTSYEEALALYQQGRYAEAAAILGQLLLDGGPVGNELHSGGKVTALLARACANQGKLAEALEWCEQAVAADKLNPGLHYLRATILQEQGRVEEAVVSLKRALYLDQNFVIAHFALGNLTRLQGKLKESDKHFENALLLLRKYGPEDILPESDGLTAGRLMEIIASTTGRGS